MDSPERELIRRPDDPARRIPRRPRACLSLRWSAADRLALLAAAQPMLSAVSPPCHCSRQSQPGCTAPVPVIPSALGADLACMGLSAH